MRLDLQYWGIAAPESDEELGARWYYYKKKLQSKIRKSWLSFNATQY